MGITETGEVWWRFSCRQWHVETSSVPENGQLWPGMLRQISSYRLQPKPSINSRRFTTPSMVHTARYLSHLPGTPTRMHQSSTSRPFRRLRLPRAPIRNHQSSTSRPCPPNHADSGPSLTPRLNSRPCPPNHADSAPDPSRLRSTSRP